MQNQKYDEIWYVTKSIGISKGFKVVYNKQEEVAVYHRIGEYDYELITVLDTEQKEIPEKKRTKFLQLFRYNTKMGDLNDIKILNSVPGSYDMLFFKNYEDAALAKLIMFKKIKEFFDTETEKLKAKMESNLPKNYDDRMKYLSTLI